MRCIWLHYRHDNNLFWLLEGEGEPGISQKTITIISALSLWISIFVHIYNSVAFVWNVLDWDQWIPLVCDILRFVWQQSLSAQSTMIYTNGQAVYFRAREMWGWQLFCNVMLLLFVLFFFLWTCTGSRSSSLSTSLLWNLGSWASTCALINLCCACPGGIHILLERPDCCILDSGGGCSRTSLVALANSHSDQAWGCC